MLNDQLTKTELLGRRPFAESIARVIVTQTEPAPQVIAIDGAWPGNKAALNKANVCIDTEWLAQTKQSTRVIHFRRGGGLQAHSHVEGD